jgi:hypothetical protein
MIQLDQLPPSSLYVCIPILCFAFRSAQTRFRMSSTCCAHPSVVDFPTLTLPAVHPTDSDSQSAVATEQSLVNSVMSLDIL